MHCMHMHVSVINEPNKISSTYSNPKGPLSHQGSPTCWGCAVRREEKHRRHTVGMADPIVSCQFLMTHAGWFQPLWKIWKSIGMIIPNIWENKKMFQTTNQDTYSNTFEFHTGLFAMNITNQIGKTSIEIKGHVPLQTGQWPKCKTPCSREMLSLGTILVQNPLQSFGQQKIRIHMMIWHDMIWYDMIWPDMIIYLYKSYVCSVWTHDIPGLHGFSHQFDPPSQAWALRSLRHRWAMGHLRDLEGVGAPAVTLHISLIYIYIYSNKHISYIINIIIIIATICIIYMYIYIYTYLYIYLQMYPHVLQSLVCIYIYI